LHPAVVAIDEEEVLRFVEDKIGDKPDNDTLESIHHVREHLTYCKEYEKIVNTLNNLGVR